MLYEVIDRYSLLGFDGCWVLKDDNDSLYYLEGHDGFTGIGELVDVVEQKSLHKNITQDYNDSAGLFYYQLIKL